MGIEIITEYGIFEILQNASFGELLTSGLLVGVIIIMLIKFIWQVATREGWL